MRGRLRLPLIALAAWRLAASASAEDRYLNGEDRAFAFASRLYHDPTAGKGDALKAFQKFVSDYGGGSKGGPAYFTLGEIEFELGLDALAGDPVFAKDPSRSALPRAAAARFQEARSAYQDALKKAVDESFKQTVLQRLGELAYDQGDFAKAIESFNAVVSAARPTYVRPLSLISLACTYGAQGKFRESEAVLKGLERRYPHYAKDPLFSIASGVAAMHNGRFAEADKYLSRANVPHAEYLQGKNYLYWGKPLLAAGLFNKLNDAGAPANLREPARFLLGDAFFLSKDYDGAAAKYSSFLADFPASSLRSAALYRIGSSQFQKGSYDDARGAFETLASQAPAGDYFGWLARYFVGESYLAAGKLPEALSAYERVAADSKSPFQAQALLKCAWVQKSLGDNAGVLKTSQKFMRYFPTSKQAPAVLLIAGNATVELGDREHAVGYYERVLDLAPQSPIAGQALFLMLKLQYDRQNYSAILTSNQYLLRQLSAAPSKWRSFSNLIVADAYLRVGRFKDAKAVYERLLAERGGGVERIYAQDGLAWCDQLLGEDRQAVVDRQRLKGMIQTLSSTSTLANLNDLGLADSFYGQKDYGEAYELYAKFAKEHPELPAAATALYRAGDSLFRQKYYSEAVETWQKLVSEKPASPEAKSASTRLADTLFRAGKYAPAQAAYRKMQADPANEKDASFISLRLAQSAYYLKDAAGALSLAQGLITHYPEAAEVADALDLAEAALEKAPEQDFRSFMRGVATAVPRSPAAAQAEFRLARRLYDAKKYAEAAAEFERFSMDHAADPLMPKAQLYLGESYFLLKEYAKAAPVFERYAASYPSTEDTPLALFHLGTSYYTLKQFSRVAGPYREIITRFGKSEYASLARFNMALALQEAGDLEKARAAYEAFLRSPAPKDQLLSALWNIVDIQQKEGHAPEAVQTLKRIRTFAPGEPAIEAGYKIGDIENAIGEKAAARRAWEALITARPAGNPYRLQALIELSKLYEKSQDYRKAMAVYKDIAQHAGNAAVAAAARGRYQELAALPRSAPRSAGRRKR